MRATEPAILFAGQGAQFVGMGRDLADAYPECNALFARANEVLGYDLASICFDGPETELVKTVHCQNAVFVSGLSCYRALCGRIHEELSGERRPRRAADAAAAGPVESRAPSLDAVGAAGLSLGEWTALHIAGSVSFEDALLALHARGRFMQDACEERDGAMLSVIGLSEETVQNVAEETGVEIANYNSPEQIVLSGERKRIAEAGKSAEAAGARRTVLLNVAGAYHSSLMSAAAGRLRETLRSVEFRAPRIPVISNVTGLPHREPDDIRSKMALQVTSSVRWVDTIRWFKNRGAAQYIECGPGRVLSGLVKRIHQEASLANVQDSPSLDKTVETLRSAIP